MAESARESRGVSDRTRAGLAAFLLLAAVLAVFGRALTNGLVYDDHLLVERNQVVRTLNPLTHASQSFWSRWEKVGEYYRPVASYSLAVDRALFGTRPQGYHATNLLLHVGNSILLLLLLRGIGGQTTALIASAFFALHPVQTEAAAWVMGRTDLLASAFMLLTAWLYLGARARGFGPGRVILMALACASALLSKESALTLPALIVGLDLALARADGAGWAAAIRGTARRLARLAPAYLALVAGYLLLRYVVLGRLLVTAAPVDARWDNPLFGEPVITRLLTAVHVAGRYLLLVLWPGALSADYRPEVVPVVRSPASMEFVLPLLTLAVAALVVRLLVRRQPVAVFGAVAAAGTYLLVSHVLFTAPIIMAERMLYLPMLGVSCLLACSCVALARWLAPARWRDRAVAGLACLALLPLGCRSFVRTADWKDDFSLFRSAAAATPRSVLAWTNLGLAHMTRGDLQAALASFDRALSIRPDYLPAQLSKAATLERAGRVDDAEVLLVHAFHDFPTSGKALFELVRVRSAKAARLAEAGQEAQARKLREQALAEATRADIVTLEDVGAGVKAGFLLVVAGNLAELQRVDQAQAAFAQAIEQAEAEVRLGNVVPETAYNVLGAALGGSAAFEKRRGRRLEAARQFAGAAEAVALAGQPLPAAHLALDAARELGAAGRPDEALEACRQAAALAPNDPDVREQARILTAGLLARRGELGAALELAGSNEALMTVAEGAMESGRAADALPIYDRLLAADPGLPRALHGRARARLALGELDGAKRDLESMLATRPSGRPAAAVWTDLARISLSRGERSQALGQLDRALEIDPDYVEARFRRGLLRVREGRAVDAEEDLLAAVRGGLPAGAEAEAWFRLAQLARSQGDLGASRQRLARCLAREPEHSGARDLLQALGG